MEGHEHPAGHLAPERRLTGTQTKALGELHPPPQGQGLEDVERPPQYPHRHHIRVGVVVHPLILGLGVTRVELVGPHHPTDDEAVRVVVVSGERGPVAGDVQDHLRALLLEEVQVTGRLVVVPRGEGHPQTGMPLEMADIRQPAAGHGVEMDELAHLAAVAARLPGV